MPPTPRSLAIHPVASAVVALARIFGPAMLKIVDRTAKITTTMSDSLYLLNAEKLPQRALKILGALGRHASGSWHITHPPSAN